VAGKPRRAAGYHRLAGVLVGKGEQVSVIALVGQSCGFSRAAGLTMSESTHNGNDVDEAADRTKIRFHAGIVARELLATL